MKSMPFVFLKNRTLLSVKLDRPTEHGAGSCFFTTICMSELKHNSYLKKTVEGVFEERRSSLKVY